MLSISCFLIQHESQWQFVGNLRLTASVRSIQSQSQVALDLLFLLRKNARQRHGAVPACTLHVVALPVRKGCLAGGYIFQPPPPHLQLNTAID